MRVVEQALVAVLDRGPDRLHLHFAAPVARRCNMPAMRAEADQRSLAGKFSRQSWPMFNSSRAVPMSVWRASPICELWAQTTAFASGPRALRTCRSVSNICVSRMFQDLARYNT